jgi:hypothetical protein
MKGRTLSNICCWGLMIAPLLILGCRVVRYEDPIGRKVTITNFLFDTKIGKMTAKTPEGGEMTIENFDSQSKALDTLDHAIQKLPAVP